MVWFATEVLPHAQIHRENARDHQTHFHLYLRPPKVLEIGGSSHQVEADALPMRAEASVAHLPPSVLSDAAQAMLTHLQSPTQTEEEFMFSIDIPFVPAQNAPTMVMALAATGQPSAAFPQQKGEKPSTTGSKNVTVEECQDVTSLSPDSSFNSIPVLQGVLYSLGYSVKQIGAGEVPLAVREAIKVTVIEPPQHGAVNRASTPPNAYFWKYVPEAGFQGKDRVAFLVEAGGRRFKLITNLLVHEVVNEYDK